MSLSFVRDVYRRAPTHTRRASSPRSRRPSLGVVNPVRPHTATDATVPAGMVRVPHMGAWPTTVGCTCFCHGNGDTSGASCDVRSCT